MISPALFNIAVNDLEKVIDGVNLSQYADDIVIWKSNRNVRYITRFRRI